MTDQGIPETEQQQPERQRRKPGPKPRMVAARSDTGGGIRSAETRAPIRERKRKGGGAVDRFEAPPPPKGWVYEWKRETVFNKSDPTYDVLVAEQGWTPVESSRHPGFMPDGATSIRRDGLILMERPVELSEEARREDLRMARDVVRSKEQALGASPPGTMERTKPIVNKNYSRIDID